MFYYHANIFIMLPTPLPATQRTHPVTMTNILDCLSAYHTQNQGQLVPEILQKIKPNI